MLVTPVAPSAVPDFPSLSDRSTYNAKAYAWALHMDVTFGPEMFALANATKTNAEDIYTNAAATSLNAAVAAAAQAAITAQNPVLNAAAASASAAQAAIYAAQAQATNPDSPIRLNPRTITANFTVGSNYNAQSTGPITISEGMTVTVSDNATYAIN